MKEKGEISNDKLESVAGGNGFYHLKTQEIMNLDGFNKEWLNIDEDNGWDFEFLAFLDKNYGDDRAAEIIGRYKSQKEMFSK